MPATLPTSPPDITAIITSLGVLSLAVAAVVAGIYKGIREVKKGGAETGKEVASGLIIETHTAFVLTESNKQLSESLGNAIREIERLIRSLDRHSELLIEALNDNRETIRSGIEHQHRLRAAIVDLVELIRRRLL